MDVFILFELYDDGSSVLLNTGYPTKRKAQRAADKLMKGEEPPDNVSIHVITVDDDVNQ